MSERDLSAPPDDFIQSFKAAPLTLRGRLLRLGPSIDSILRQHGYPQPVASVLGEALTLAALLAATLKYDGVFTLQTKGDGAVSLLVADVTSEGALRGYAQYDGDRLATIAAPGQPGPSASVPRLLGAGYLAFTVDQGTHTERYQGIVELTGVTLADCAHHYFRQSEQLETGIRIAVGQGVDGAWRTGGLLVQRLPPAGGEVAALSPRQDEDEAEDGWRRALVMVGSAATSELLDPGLAAEMLLYRLFHEKGVRVWPPKSLRHSCRCSPHRVEAMLRQLQPTELADLLVDGKLIITCEYCNARYTYDDHALLRLDPKATGAQFVQHRDVDKRRNPR